jgi:hypothetical protein
MSPASAYSYSLSLSIQQDLRGEGSTQPQPQPQLHPLHQNHQLSPVEASPTSERCGGGGDGGLLSPDESMPMFAAGAVDWDSGTHDTSHQGDYRHQQEHQEQQQQQQQQQHQPQENNQQPAVFATDPEAPPSQEQEQQGKGQFIDIEVVVDRTVEAEGKVSER